MDFESIRSKTLIALNGHNVPMHPHLPLIDVQSLKDAKCVCKRIVALYSLAGIANGADAALLKEWLIEDGAWNFLTQKEKMTLEKDNFSREEMNELSWKQESLYTLCWTGKIIQEMVWSDGECDLSNAFESIPPEVSFSQFFDSFTLRSIDDLAAALDLYYCLNASVVHPEIWSDVQKLERSKFQ